MPLRLLWIKLKLASRQRVAECSGVGLFSWGHRLMILASAFLSLPSCRPWQLRLKRFCAPVEIISTDHLTSGKYCLWGCSQPSEPCNPNWPTGSSFLTPSKPAGCPTDLDFCTCFQDWGSLAKKGSFLAKKKRAAVPVPWPLQKVSSAAIGPQLGHGCKVSGSFWTPSCNYFFKEAIINSSLGWMAASGTVSRMTSPLVKTKVWTFSNKGGQSSPSWLRGKKWRFPSSLGINKLCRRYTVWSQLGLHHRWCGIALRKYKQPNQEKGAMAPCCFAGLHGGHLSALLVGQADSLGFSLYPTMGYHENQF